MRFFIFHRTKRAFVHTLCALQLAQKYPHCSQYEPELSVGLIWRSADPRATLRIHTTGSITVTGGELMISGLSSS